MVEAEFVISRWDRLFTINEPAASYKTYTSVSVGGTEANNYSSLKYTILIPKLKQCPLQKILRLMSISQFE